MLSNTTTTVFEWCPHCEEEVEIEFKFKVQICPNCGAPILPCSVVDGCFNRCNVCPLEKDLSNEKEQRSNMHLL